MVFALVSAFMTPVTAWAQSSSRLDSEASGPSHEIRYETGAWYESSARFASTKRLFVVGGADDSTIISPKLGRKPQFLGSALIDFGAGAASFETGVIGMQITDSIAAKATTAGYVQNLSLHYVGIPILAKLNYIETPMNSLSLRAGVLGAMLVNGGTEDSINGRTFDQNKVTLNRSAAFALLGVTGTVDISEHKSVALVFNFDYFRGLTDADSAHSKASTIFLSSGVMFTL